MAIEHWANRIVNRPMAYAHKSDEEVAGMVRMLMRDDLEHESVCVAARDRIAKLSHDVAELEQEAASLRNETASANLSRLELQNLARRVVEIFEPMQQKGQNGHTFELLLERAKKCLES